MSLVYRRRKRLDKDTAANLGTGGVSLSRRVGSRVTVSSRGRVAVRLLPGLSFRFRLW